MPGILDFLSNPKVQDTALSLAGAATFGINPILGLVAAPLVHDHREKSRLELETARQGLSERKRADAALESLPGMLGPIRPEELSINPITGEPLSAPDEGNRPGVAAEKKMGAIDALMKIAPGAASQQLLQTLMPTKRSSSGILATAEAIRAENEGMSLVDSLRMAGQIHAATDPNAALATQELLQRIMKNQLEIDDLTRAGESADLTITGTAENVLNTATSALDLNRKLTGTLLEPGSLGAQAPRWALSVAELAAGVVDTEDARALREQIINLDKFKKDVVDLNTQVFAMLEGAGVSMSNQLRDQITAGSANIGIDSRANQTIIFRTLERALAVAEQQGVQIPELREIQNNLIHRFEGNGSEPDGSAGLDAYLRSMEGFADMPPQKQAELRAMLIETLREAK